jgi:hypothetical protein
MFAVHNKAGSDFISRNSGPWNEVDITSGKR